MFHNIFSIKFEEGYLVALLFFMLKYALFFTLLLQQETVFAQSNVTALTKVKLFDLHNKPILFAEKLPIVFAFLSVDCPLSQKYTLTLNNIDSIFAGKAKILGIIPGNNSSEQKSSALAFEEKYKIRFSILIDKKLHLVKKLNATITPEVFVTDMNKTIIYHGAIDDWVFSLGNTKPKPSRHYLRDALKETLTNKTPSISFIQPIGCYIEY